MGARGRSVFELGLKGQILSRSERNYRKNNPPGVRVPAVARREFLESDPESLRRYELVGRNMVAKEHLTALMEHRGDFQDAYWIWDHNHSVRENEELRAADFKVLGGGEYAYRMEH